jgi:hypothetical protein
MSMVPGLDRGRDSQILKDGVCSSRRVTSLVPLLGIAVLVLGAQLTSIICL